MMPLEAVTAITGLLSNFVGEGRARDADAWDQFRLEFDSKNHKHLIELIDSNHLLASEIKQLLTRNHDELKIDLKSFNEQVARIGSTTVLGGVIEAIAPNHQLSAGAIDILQTMEKYHAKSIHVEAAKLGGDQSKGPKYRTDNSQAFWLDEPRFAEDDFSTLVDMRLLRPDVTEKGNMKYHITRSAVDLVMNLNKNR